MVIKFYKSYKLAQKTITTCNRKIKTSLNDALREYDVAV